MLQVNIGIADTTNTVNAATLTAAAAALNVQVTRDLPQFWPVNATVSVLPDARSIPQGVWPVLIVDNLPPDEGGFHLTSHNQPYAKVIATPGSNDWVVDASHETIEMLIDPAGNRLQASGAIAISGDNVVDANGTFEYLVEACDPCEANNYGYTIDSFLVSDFITPHFYDGAPTPGTRFSFTGAIERPRQLLPGGYITWVNPETDEFEQILWLGAKPVHKVIGRASGSSVRVFVENKTFHNVHLTRAAPSKVVHAFRAEHAEMRQEVARLRARYYR